VLLPGSAALAGGHVARSVELKKESAVSLCTLEGLLARCVSALASYVHYHRFGRESPAVANVRMLVS